MKTTTQKKTGQQLREELKKQAEADYVVFRRSDLPGLTDEMEGIFNKLAAMGQEPSERFIRLLLWMRQEEKILNDPAYLGDFQCDHCGYGNPEFKCPKCGYGNG